MRNRKNNNEFANREGFHEFSQREGRGSQFSNRDRSSRSSYDDGMARSEKNDYRSTSGSTYGSRGSNNYGESYVPSTDYDFNRAGYRGDSSGFSGQNRGEYGSQHQQNRADADRSQYGQNDYSQSDYNRNEYGRSSGSQDWSPSQDYGRSPRSMSGRFDQDYSTRRALEDRELGVNQNSPSNYQSYDRDSSRDYTTSRNDYRSSRDYSSDFGSRDQGSGFSSNEGRFASPYGSDSSYLGESQRWPKSFSSSPESSWSSQSRGQHSGKGPKGYRRSDERIKEEVSEALSHHPEIDASEIEVDVAEGMVTLSGTVESRQIKRMAEDLVEGLSGVSDVKNDLRVMPTDSSSRAKMSSSFDSTKVDSMDYGRASAATSGSSKSSPQSRSGATATQTTSGKSVQ